jgi:hypothetical protein
MCLLTTKKIILQDVLCLTSNQMNVTALRTWAQDCLYQRHTHTQLQMQSHGFSMPPVSIKQLRATS